MKKVLVVLMIIVLVLGITGCRYRPDKNITDYDLKVVDVEWELDGEWIIVSGYIENNEKRNSMKYLTVTSYLIDNHGNIVDAIKGYTFDETESGCESKFSTIDQTDAKKVRDVYVQITYAEKLD